MLTEEHNKKRMNFALDFLTGYAEAGDEFLDHIVTGDKTWVYHHTSEYMQQLIQWYHSISVKKIMASIFWDKQGILLFEIMPPDTTINAAAYCQTLKHPRRAIQNRRRTGFYTVKGAGLHK
ncbi:transposase [Trichonephila clavipes]|nr:transposase [Trichonephila clavipes]